MFTGFSFSRYRSILIAIFLFLVLVLGILGLNIYISFQTGAKASEVNLAARQRSLAQGLENSLLYTETLFVEEEDYKTSYQEFTDSAALFDQTLEAFLSGGEVQSASGELVTVNTVTSAESKQALNDALEIWESYKVQIAEIRNYLTSFEEANSSYGLDTGSRDGTGTIFKDADPVEVIRAKVENILFLRKVTTDTLRSTIEFADQNTDALGEAMNVLASDLERAALNTAASSQQIQIAGIIGALILFMFIASRFLFQIRLGDQAAEEARHETRQILDTVDQGLFLMDQTLSMGTQYSKEMVTIFADEHIAGRNFPAYINNLVSENDSKRVQRFFGLLFDPHKKQELLGDLNPLKQVSVQVKEGADKYVNKFLRFSFSRIMGADGISRILTAVNDITEEVRLEQELEKANKKNEQQVELLTTLINTDPAMLPLFIRNSYDKYEKANKILRAQSDSTREYKQKAGQLMTLIHSVKGESSALSLDAVVELCHDFEEQIKDLRNKKDVAGNDFLGLAVKLDQLITYTHLINDLYEKVFTSANDAGSEQATASAKVADWKHLHKLVGDVSERQGKRVNLMLSGLDSPDLTPDMVAQINTISVQLIRNSIVHGIEAATNRMASNKPSHGYISISLAKTIDGEFMYVFKDDGAGININKVIQQAVASGLINTEQASRLDRKAAAQLILSPEISTSKSTDIDGGRGAGMSAVSAAVEEMGGKIFISTVPGKGSVFKVLLPKVASQPKKVA